MRVHVPFLWGTHGLPTMSCTCASEPALTRQSHILGWQVGENVIGVLASLPIVQIPT